MIYNQRVLFSKHVTGYRMDSEFFSSINDVSKRLGVPAYTLRYWEKQFPSAIRPTTGAGGRRYYRTETVKKIETIKSLLYTRGMTIAGVKKLMRDGNFPDSDDEFNITKSPVHNSHDAGNDITSTKSPSIDTDMIDSAVALLQTARDLLQ